MSETVRVRFAPSPTGYLHVGGARTALFNWLFARHHGGEFVLRIEDTDKQRNTVEAVQVIYDGLRWLGLDWDEGPLIGGNYGPYFQSEREAIYESYFQRLQAGGHLYEDGGAWRFRFVREVVEVDDLICGKVAFDFANVEIMPDMTVRRPDGSWIFHFVNVVDDIEMRITHVIRGEDHLSNTPKHLQLYSALGAEPPRFAHIPLILNKDGSKMSKRDQGASITSYIEAGFAPEAVSNYLCLLGWSPKDNREKLPVQTMIELFDLANVNRKSAIFDLEKCAWLSGEWFRDMSSERFRLLARESLARANVNIAHLNDEYVDAAIDTCMGKLRTLKELPVYAGFYFTGNIDYDKEGRNKYFVLENITRLELIRDAFSKLESFSPPDLEAALKSIASQLGVKVGILVHPTRLACTGRTAGPSLYHLLSELGRHTVFDRLSQAILWIQTIGKRPRVRLGPQRQLIRFSDGF